MATICFHNLPKDVEERIFEYARCIRIHDVYINNCTDASQVYWERPSFWKGKYDMLKTLAKMYNVKCKGVRYIIEHFPEDAKDVLNEDESRAGLGIIRADFDILLNEFYKVKTALRTNKTEISKLYVHKAAYVLLDYIHNIVLKHSAFKNNDRFKVTYSDKMKEFEADGLDLSRYHISENKPLSATTH